MSAHPATDRHTLRSAAPARHRTDYAGPMTEVFFTSLLVLVSVFIAWFSVYVIYRLFKSE
jgi:hypothetical protein